MTTKPRKPTDPRPNLAGAKALLDVLTGGDGTVEIAHKVTLPGRPVEVQLGAGEVCDYLKATLWRETTQAEDDDRYFIRRTKNPDIEVEMVRVPRGDAADVRDRLGKTLTAIGESEQRHPLDVAASIVERRVGNDGKRAARKG